MELFGDSKPEQVAQPRGVNGNVRDISATSKHVAVVDSPHTDATRRSDHAPRHAN